MHGDGFLLQCRSLGRLRLVWHFARIADAFDRA
jgi:hypothetical protein